MTVCAVHSRRAVPLLAWSRAIAGVSVCERSVATALTEKMSAGPISLPRSQMILRNGPLGKRPAKLSSPRLNASPADRSTTRSRTRVKPPSLDPSSYWVMAASSRSTVRHLATASPSWANRDDRPPQSSSPKRDYEPDNRCSWYTALAPKMALSIQSPLRPSKSAVNGAHRSRSWPTQYRSVSS